MDDEKQPSGSGEEKKREESHPLSKRAIERTRKTTDNKKKSIYLGGEKPCGLLSGLSKIPRPVTEQAKENAEVEEKYKSLCVKYRNTVDEIKLLQKQLKKRKEGKVSQKNQAQERFSKVKGEKSSKLTIVSADDLSSNTQNKHDEKAERGFTNSEEMEKLRTENNKLKERVKELEEEYFGQKMYLEKMRKEVPELELNYQKLKDEIKKTEVNQDNIEGKLCGQKKKVEELSLIVNQTSIHSNKFKNMAKELEVLRSELKMREEKPCNFSEIESSIDEEAHEVIQKLEKERELRESLEKELREALEERGSLELKYKELEAQYQRIIEEEEGRDSKEVIENLRKELISAWEEMQRKEDEFKEASNAQITEMERMHFAEQEKLLGTFQEESEERANVINDLSGKINELHRKLKSQEDKNDMLLKSNEIAQNEVDRLRSELEKRVLELGEKDANILTREVEKGKTMIIEDYIQSPQKDKNKVSAQGGFNEIFFALEEKNRALEKLIRKLDEVERSHEKCAMTRTFYEDRMAILESTVAYGPYVADKFSSGSALGRFFF